MIARLFLMIAVAMVGLSHPALAQCRSADDHSNNALANLRILVAATSGQDAHTRADLKLPVVDPSTVVLVTQSQTCQKALAAHVSVLPTDYQPVPTSAYVFKVGTTYVVMTRFADGNVGTFTVMSSKYVVLARYAH